MHSISAGVAHPNQKYFVGQSLDNKIVVKRTMFTRKLQEGSKSNIAELQNHATNYLTEFSIFCKNTIENNDILDYELAEVCK